MPLPIHSEYKPPKSWEEFEDLCADLYALIWNDPETQKHGRQGQPQGGVDIYGKRVGKKYRGVQCKKKKSWPPTKITTTEIDEEIKKARTWKPGLKHFIIATTADNDDKIQLHARKITAKHKEKGLFSVEIVSWEQITRQLTNYKPLLIKYGYLPDIDDTVKLAVTETLRQTASQGKSAELAAEDASGVGDALERDLAARYERAMRRSFFPEALQGNEFASVAEIAREPAYSTTSSDLRRSVLLRAARNEAVRGSLEKAKEYLDVAQRLKGSESDVLARARIIERSDVDAAIALIRDIKEPDARSTVMNMLVRHRSAADGLKWFAENKLNISDLTINGVQTLVNAYLQSQDFETLRPILEDLTATQLSDAPYFRFVRAMINVASILPIPDRQLAVGAFQMDARRGTRSVLDPATSATRLDRAISDLNALIPLATELQLPNAKRLAEAYLRWCELLHPHRKAAALTQLREEVKDPALARDRLALAFAFDRKNFKPDAIEAYLRKRQDLGGLDDDDLKAALIIRIHSEDPASVAALIAKYRARFEETYKDPPIFTIELQALALAKETSSARLLLEKHKSELTPDGFAMFESLIAKSEGQDPVAEDLKVYKATKNADALRALVGSLVDRKDHRATAKYAEELFDQSSDPRDIATAAYALAQLGDGTEFSRIIEAYPFLEENDPEFRRYYAWELFRRGRLAEAKERADLLIKNAPKHRDLQLEIAIAVESGEWETLAKPLAAFLDDVSKHSGLELIRAAHTAQQSSQGPMLDLLRAAIAKADNNPHVWLGAYSLVIEEGLEEDLPDSHLWLRKALALSDKSGPVQQFELKELVPQQLEWNKRARDISDRITRAEVPLVIAAPGLRTTVVDILLRNLIRNTGIEDARRKYVLPLFSGHRAPTQVGTTYQSLALDVSSLLVLGWLGLLPKVLTAFQRVSLPATVMTELFEGRQRVQQVQKSRIRRARELEAALRRNLKVARPVERTNDLLAGEMGPSLAALVRAAQANGGTIVRPAPVHKPGLEQEIADVTEALPHLTDMHTLLKVLADQGAVDQATQETAQQYFDVQDKKLPGCATPDPNKPLFIDGLALVYLQYTNLLGAVLKVFKDVRIEGSSEDEALAIIEHDKHVEEVLRVINDIRATIRGGSSSGKVVFGSRHDERGKRKGDDAPSTLHLLSDLTGIDALVCDDRALNKENLGADNRGRRVPCLTTLDLLEELKARNAIKEIEWTAARHKLRIGGAALVPLTMPEVANAAKRSGAAISAEMRAIQESVDLARVAEVPSFPREIQWFASVTTAIKSALFEIWKSETDPGVASRLSNLVWSSIPRPRNWVSRWEPSSPPNWADAIDRIVLTNLAMPIEIADDNKVRAYNAWLEADVLESIRSIAPDRYGLIIKEIKSFILTAEEDHEDDVKKEKGGKKASRRPATKDQGKRSHVATSRRKPRVAPKKRRRST